MWKTFSPSESNLYDTGSDLGFVPGLSLAPASACVTFWNVPSAMSADEGSRCGDVRVALEGVNVLVRKRI